MLGYSDPFTLGTGVQGITNNHVAAALNPYAQDASSLSGTAFYQNTSTFAQPAQYHNYAPLGPHRENLLAYQRTAHDFFMPDKLREELQKKAESTLQILPSSTLPNIDHFHSLVPLDTSGQRSSTTFGYVTWLYKAQSSKDGKYYALRRLEGFRLTNEKAIHAARQWKQVDNGSIVHIHEAFTTREFGDSSLIVVTDYHPNSKSLAETHLQSHSGGRYGSRQQSPHVPENVLWSYIVQLASAIKACHSLRLAVRTIVPNKIIVTSKNRIRLNACGILDIVQFDSQFQLEQLKQDDFVQLGRLILSIAGNANAALNIGKAMEHLTRTYTPKLRECVTWLISSDTGVEKNIDVFLQGISGEMAQALDMQFHETDTLTQTLMAELENGRLVRLMAKLGLINERPEYEHNPQWSETGERYYLKLFRDYVFHAVDEQGRPITDLGHIINCLNKLDAGSEERIQLCSRDEQSVFVVSFKEIKKGIENAFGELSRRRA
ncbi:hypothetical protein, variant [Verruconis gallopava]|nr:hypothetical protein, variant [Verruconis gallopava]KIW04755.1 hypothetical protein, variant [Verruconis gallopava]